MELHKRTYLPKGDKMPRKNNSVAKLVATVKFIQDENPFLVGHSYQLPIGEAEKFIRHGVAIREGMSQDDGKTYSEE